MIHVCTETISPEVVYDDGEVFGIGGFGPDVTGGGVDAMPSSPPGVGRTGVLCLRDVTP